MDREKERKKPVKVISVVGPTASGKSSLAIELASTCNGEIISADSMQIYQAMDIGTAKADAEEQNMAVHHLLDVISYEKPWNVAEFQRQCRFWIEDIASRGKVPILCGGTGLYVKAALYDYVFAEDKTDPQLTAALEARSNEELVELLKRKDPAALEKIHPNNRKRLLRAAAIVSAGRSKSETEAAQQHAPLYDVLFIGLQDERTREVARINQRVDRMFRQGLAEEVTRLFSDPATWEYTSFQGIGYKEFKPWFEKQATLDDVREAIKIHTRQYAKRQMTWFRNQMPVCWFHPGQNAQIIQKVHEFLNASEQPEQND